MELNHSFHKGLNTDVDREKYPSNSYFRAQNFRLYPNAETSGFALTSPEGNSLLNIKDNGFIRDEYVIIGGVSVRDDIVIFYAKDDDTGYGILDLLKYKDGTYLRIELWQGNGLNFYTSTKIRAISRYESDQVIKVYWTDGINQLRYANIAPDLNTNPYSVFSYSTINSQSFSSFNALNIIGQGYIANTYYDNDGINGIPSYEYINGEIPIGSVQYAYRFIKRYGTESNFSSPSQLFYMTDTNFLSLKSLKGSIGEEGYLNSQKGLKFYIDFPSYMTDLYDYIEVVSIQYTTNNTNPTINILSDLELKHTVQLNNWLIEHNIDSTNYPTLDSIKYTYNRATVLDTGTNYIGTLSLTEYNLFKNPTKVDYLESKDDYLFGASTEESYFDIDEYVGEYVDTRAYRFNWIELDIENSYAKVYNNAGFNSDYIILTKNSPSYDIVPEEHNCLNKFNFPELEENYQIDSDQFWLDYYFTYRYDENSTIPIIGGMGKHIEYTIIEDTIDICDYSEDPSNFEMSLNTTNTNTQDNITGRVRGLQPDEVYRIGVVWFDKYGRSSYVKWIGDVRMPGTRAYRVNFKVNGDKVTAKSFGIEFKFKDLPTKLQDLDYQFVYVKRERKDRTVLFTGMLNKAFKSGGKFYPIASIQGNFSPENPYIETIAGSILYKVYTTTANGIATYIIYKSTSTVRQITLPLKVEIEKTDGSKILTSPGTDFTILENNIAYVRIIDSEVSLLPTDELLAVIFSPEISSGVDLKETNLYLKYEGGLQYVINDKNNPSNTNIPYTTNYSADYSKYNFYAYLYPTNSIIDILDYKIHKSNLGDQPIQLYGENKSSKFTPVIWGENASRSILGSCMVVKLDSNKYTDSFSYYYYGGNYVLVKQKVIQYGGYTYADRQKNEYIPLTLVNQNKSVFGDTYIGNYQYLSSVFDINRDYKLGSSFMSTTVVPMYSSININFWANKQFAHLATSENAFLMQEYSGDHIYINGPDVGDELKFTQEDDLYMYNTAYSALPTSKIFVAKPDRLTNIDKNDVKIVYSEKKINNEERDNWLIFKPDNYNTVDSNYGPITGIVEFNNELIVFQQSALAKASINTRILQKSLDGITNVLGTGEVLDKFLYISTSIGNNNQSDIIKSKAAIYWLDSNNKKIYRLGSKGLEPLSDTHYTSSLFINSLDEDSKLTGVYDKKFNEILLTISNYKQDITYTEIAANTYSVGSSAYIEMNSGDYNTYKSSVNLILTLTFMPSNRDDLVVTLVNVGADDPANNRYTIGLSIEEISKKIQQIIIDNDLINGYRVTNNSGQFGRIEIISLDDNKYRFEINNDGSNYGGTHIMSIGYNSYARVSNYKNIKPVNDITYFYNHQGFLETYDEPSEGITNVLSIYNKFHLFRTGKNYIINGALYKVINVDNYTLKIYLSLIEGVATTGVCDLWYYMYFPNNTTLVFNEAYDIFTGEYKMLPSLYIETNKDYFTSDNKKDLYEANAGFVNTFFNETSLSFIDIISSNAEVTEFTNIEWSADVYRDDVLLPNNTFCTVQSWNTEQFTDEVRLYPLSKDRPLEDTSGYDLPNNGISIGEQTNLSKMHNLRKNINNRWNTQLPRDRSDFYDNPNNQNPTSDRLRSKFIFTRLKFDPTPAKCVKIINK